MEFRASVVVLLSIGLWGCGETQRPVVASSDSVQKQEVEPKVAAEPSATTSSEPWWIADTPFCASGELKQRSLTWGRVFWCAGASAVDRNLQNDLGRLARCIQETVNSFQLEPEGNALAEFLRRADRAGLNLVLCGAIRREGNASELSAYNGRPIKVHRKVMQEEAAEGGPRRLDVRYRFTCDDCAVASETSATVVGDTALRE